MNTNLHSKRHVLVWGGSGFIGRALLRALLARDDAVTVLSRKDVYGLGQQYPQLRIIETGFSLDSNALLALRQAVRDADVIFNVSGSSGAVDSNQNAFGSLQTNSPWQLALLNACSAEPRRVHVVFASTRLVYGKPRFIPVAEDHPLSPESMYAAHKLCTEHYHQIYALQGAITYTICRISNPYGVDDHGLEKNYGILNKLIQSAIRRQPITVFGDGRQVRDYIHINDLVRALLLCGEHQDAVNQVFNVGSGHGTSILEAASEVGRIAGAPVVYCQWPEQYRLIETGDYVNNIEKAKSRLGFFPEIGFKEGIQQVLLSASSRRGHHDNFETISRAGLGTCDEDPLPW